MDLRLIGKNLKEIRTELGLTQEKLAEKSGSSWRYLQAVEQGNRIPSIKWLNTLSENIEFPLEVFFRV